MKSFEFKPVFQQDGKGRSNQASRYVARDWVAPIIAWAAVMAILVALVAIVLNPPY